MIRDESNAVDEAATEPIADLPLFSREEIERSERRRPAVEATVPTAPSAAPTEGEPLAEQVTLPVEPPPKPVEKPAASGEVGASTGSTEPRTAPLAARFRAAALDALAMAAVLLILLAGGTLLGAPTSPAALPFYLPTWCLFSLLYHVVPLLFWGRTPGMAYVGLVSRSLDGGPLALGQALRRWLVSLGSLLLLGTPGLLRSEGRSPVDRLSDSTTLIGA